MPLCLDERRAIRHAAGGDQRHTGTLVPIAEALDQISSYASGLPDMSELDSSQADVQLSLLPVFMFNGLL
jgi:hypothetical protein